MQEEVIMASNSHVESVDTITTTEDVKSSTVTKSPFAGYIWCDEVTRILSEFQALSAEKRKEFMKDIKNRCLFVRKTQWCRNEECKYKNCHFCHDEAEFRPCICAYDEDCVNEDCQFFHTGQRVASLIKIPPRPPVKLQKSDMRFDQQSFPSLSKPQTHKTPKAGWVIKNSSSETVQKKNQIEKNQDSSMSALLAMAAKLNLSITITPKT